MFQMSNLQQKTEIQFDKCLPVTEYKVKVGDLEKCTITILQGSFTIHGVIYFFLTSDEHLLEQTK